MGVLPSLLFACVHQQVAQLPAWSRLKEPALASHVGVDPRGRGIGVAQHILNELRIISLLNHQRSTGVTKGVSCDLGIIDTDGAEPPLDDKADGLAVDALRLDSSHVIGEERIAHLILTLARCVVLEESHHLVRDHHRLVLVGAALALDVQHAHAVHQIEVTDVDALHLAAAKTVAEHQQDHQLVPLADKGGGVDALQQGAGLLACQGQLVILLLLVAALDAEGDVIAVLLPFAPRVEDLDHCHIAVDGEAALASLREAVLVVDDITPPRLPRIHSLRLEVAEPQADLTAVVTPGGWQSIRLRDPLIDYLIQC